MSVAECQERISSREFLDWQIAWEREPWGLEMFQMAQLLCMFYNTNKKKNAKKLSVDDFMPSKQRKKKVPTKQLLSNWHSMMTDIQAAKQNEKTTKWLAQR